MEVTLKTAMGVPGEIADRGRESRTRTATASSIGSSAIGLAANAIGARHAGLGLSIARTIIQSYGGAIAAANRDGGGRRSKYVFRELMRATHRRWAGPTLSARLPLLLYCEQPPETSLTELTRS